MKLSPVCTEPAADTPVSLAEAKANSRIDHTGDDDFVTALIGAAVAHLDGHAGVLGRCMVTSSWSQALSCWPSTGMLVMPFPDCDPATVEITYSDTTDADQVVDPALYQVLEGAEGTTIVFRRSFAWPSLYDDRVDRVRIAFDAGYGAAEDVPEALKHAIKLLVSHWYENREEVVVGQSLQVLPIPKGVDALIGPYRRVGV